MTETTEKGTRAALYAMAREHAAEARGHLRAARELIRAAREIPQTWRDAPARAETERGLDRVALDVGRALDALVPGTRGLTRTERISRALGYSPSTPSEVARQRRLDAGEDTTDRERAEASTLAAIDATIARTGGES